MVMKKIRMIFIAMLCFIAVRYCTGCDNTVELSDKECIEYLNERYGRKFELVSSEIITSDNYCYLDEDMKIELEEECHIGAETIKVLTCKDEDGIEFHLTQVYGSGMGRGWVTSDDYCVQWAKNQPHIYGELINSEFECEIYNEIGYAESPWAAFIIYIDDFSELKQAVELVYDIANNKESVLPGTGKDRKDVKENTVDPYIMILSKDEVGVGSIRLYAEYEEKEETTLEEYIRKFSFEYVDEVREGSIEETLSVEILNQYGPNYFHDIKYNNEDVELVLYRDIGDNEYIKKENKQLIYFIYENVDRKELYDIPQVLAIAKCAGYEIIKKGKHEVCFSNGIDEVVINTREGDVFFYKNGKKVKLQGGYDLGAIRLTTDDFYTLFGMKVEFDFVNEKVELKKK